MSDRSTERRVSELFAVLQQGFRTYAAFYDAQAKELQSRLANASNDSDDSEATEEIGDALRLAKENAKLYESHLVRVIKLHEQHLRTRRQLKDGRSESVGDLRSAKSVSGMLNPSPLINHHSRLVDQKQKSAASAIERDLFEMLGRVQIDIKAIVGFARLGSGDVFEVTIRHGSQKWKARGKTLADKTQKWDHNSVIMNVLPRQNIDVKVIEVKLFRSRTLSERSFDPCKFFVTESQDITMNLNAVGTIRLQLVATWIPLLTSKTGRSTLMQSQSTQLLRTTSKVADVNVKASKLNMSQSFVGVPDDREKPRVLMRDKKRGRQHLSNNNAHWRSSTNMLDSVYNDLSKSIPTIDSLSVLNTTGSKHNINSCVSSPRFSSTLKPWNRSISMNHLMNNDDSSDSGISGSMTDNLVKIDELLQLVDGLRNYVLKLRRDTEVICFESLLLKWEALLKMNRNAIDDLKKPRNKRITKRASMYHQPSPSSASDELDDNVILNSGDHISENDSGIDSLRQHISPYNTHSGFHSFMKNESHSPFGGYNTTGRNESGPSQRRFKQFKDRRKSLGVMLDTATHDYERVFLNSDKFWDPDNESFASSSMRATDGASATGHREIDDCLKHHLLRATTSVKILGALNGPLEYRAYEMLYRLEQDSLCLDQLYNLCGALPTLPNLSNVLADLNASSELQEIWLSACYPVNAVLVASMEDVRREVKNHFKQVIEMRYPELVDTVVDMVMSMISDRGEWSPKTISVFQFVSFFRGMHLAGFIENVSHEAWIADKLNTRDQEVIEQLMIRLNRVPVVPPIETLRQMGLILVENDSNLREIIGRYLQSASSEMIEDLTSCFMCLLEHPDEDSRRGACRALVVLEQQKPLPQLEFLAQKDECGSVRREAQTSVSRLSKVSALMCSSGEMTKI
uniref:PL48 domain-containing protein n=1 Tax=Steinernema glaseri TaxID=37863 RepID=A0A1I7XYS1_9BILA